MQKDARTQATGSFDPRTAGHPRCATSSLAECAGALSAFGPVVVLDALAAALAAAKIYPRKAKAA